MIDRSSEVEDRPAAKVSASRRTVVATLALVAGSYLGLACVATYPVARTFGSELPGQLTDPLEHLWLMKWSRACLIEGRSPFFCPDLNAPSGVPLGYFPTMHLQTVGYVLLRLTTENDVACFNTLWFSGFVATGLGGFVLAWWTVRNLGAAWLAGLGLMLSGPMMMHAHGHLETMQMGAVPVFLIAWLRFVDRPGRAGLLAATGLYLLVVACAPYFAVLAVFPAAWYVVWSFATCDRGGRGPWLRARGVWLAGFVLLAMSGLIMLFASQVWAAVHHYPMGRTRSEFDQLGAPWWSGFVPSPLHLLGRWRAPGLFASTGYSSRMSECSSYLGVVGLGLLAYAAIRRVPFARVGYWWSALILMMVLSWGSSMDLGWARIGLPAGWIYGVFPPFHLIRVPARFNLFASTCAVVPVAAALADLAGRIGRRPLRLLLGGGCLGLMMADLSMIPFETSVIPPMPKIYGDLTRQDPQTSFVEVPQFGSHHGQVFSSLWGYWQSIHQGRTTAGYPGLPNVPFESEVVRGSPFSADRLVDPAYLAKPGLERFGPSHGLDPRDSAWLFLEAHRLDHVVVHHGTWTDPKYRAGCDRIETLLAEAKVFEDEDVAVFDRERLSPPGRLTWLCAEGFRPSLIRSNSWSYGVLKKGRIAVYVPQIERSIVLRLMEASAFRSRRVVQLMLEGREVARWSVEAGPGRTLESPPFRVGPGTRELSLLVDGDDRPARSADRLDEARTAYGLRINAVEIVERSTPEESKQ